MAHTVIYQANGVLYGWRGFKVKSELEITSKLERALEERGIKKAEKIKIYRKDFYN